MINSCVRTDSGVRQWETSQPPIYDSKDWENSVNGPAWAVSLDADTICLTLAVEDPRFVGDKLLFPIDNQSMCDTSCYGDICSKRVDDGYLMGFDGGEFGACFCWYSADGQSTYKISDDQIVGYIDSDSGLLAIEGLRHLGTSRGNLIRIQKSSTGRWESTQVLDLNDAPQAATKGANGIIYIVTATKLWKFSNLHDVTVLVETAFWKFNYPNSVVVTKQGIVYIGMRGGVAKVSEVAGEQIVEWMKPRL